MHAELRNGGECREQEERAERERARTAPFERQRARDVGRQIPPGGRAGKRGDQRRREKDRAPTEITRQHAAQRGPSAWPALLAIAHALSASGRSLGS